MSENEARSPNTKWAPWIIGILIISLVFNIRAYNKMNQLQREIRDIQNNIMSLNYSINNSVSSNMNHINDALKREASIITEFKYEFGEYKDKRIDLLLQAKPKMYTAGDRIYFSYKSGNERPVLVEAQSENNIDFVAKVNVSILNAIDVDLVIDNGATRKTERLDSIYRPAENFTARLNAHPMGGSMSYNKSKGSLLLDYGFQLIDAGNAVGTGEYTLNEVKLSVFVNDKAIDTKDMLNSNNGEYGIVLDNYEIPCKTGDLVDIYITAQDNMGFRYKALVETWKIGTNGVTEQSDKMIDMGRIEIE